MATRFERLLKQRLRELQQNRGQHLLSNLCPDYHTYTQRMGYMEALAHVDKIIEEIEEEETRE